MLRSYAILMDGAFVLKRLKARLKRHPTATDVVTESDRIRSLPVLGRLSLLRIDFYDAPPATRLIRNPIDGQEINLGRTDVHRRCQALQDALALTPDHALRLGETDVRGWWMNGRRIRSLVGLPHPRSLQPTDIEPDIQQKGVDLRIGLDIARLSLREHVEVIVAVTGDSDLVPAFKFARREGVRVYLDHMQSGVKVALKVHADLVL